MKLTASLLTTAALLTGCAAAPVVRVTEVCPIPPPLDLQLPPAAQAESFSARMERFLSGSLETPISYELHSTDVRLPTIQSGSR